MTNRIIIAGAPCAGKSTYAQEHAEAGALVYDYDTLHQALSGLENHQHLNELRPYVIAARDAVFAQLEAHASQAAYIITSAPDQSTIDALVERFDAELVFLDITPAEAHRRADIDERPEIWHTYIDNWFASADLKSRKGEKLMKFKQKTYQAVMQFKENGEQGEFSAVFATLNVKDHDGDVTPVGAFKQGQEVIVEPWNHGWELPAGKGRIYSDEQTAWIEGSFFMDTEVGLENYKTVKNMGELAEWSYTFYVLESSQGDFEGEMVTFLEKLDTLGVSPVTRGAGIGTHTQDIKSKDPDDVSDPEGEADHGKLISDIETRVKVAQASIMYQRSLENG